MQKITKSSQKFKSLKVDEVYKVCDNKTLAKKVKTEIKPHYDIISQSRAVRAISMGLEIQKPGYNIYLAGIHGTGKKSVLHNFLKKTADKRKTPFDWIYVNNFEDSESPIALEIPTGTAKRFKKQMDDFIETLTNEFVDAFQSEEYETQVNHVINVSNEKKQKLFAELEKLSKTKSFGIKSTRMGIITVPIINGKPLSEKDYAELNEKQKSKIEVKRNQLEPDVLDFARKVRTIESGTKEKLDALQKKLGDYVITQELAALLKEYAKQKNIIDYLNKVKAHILENLNDFLPDEDTQATESDGSALTLPTQNHKTDPHLPYRINVFVDNTSLKGAPIIFETNPTFYNLFGKIEKNVEYGVYTTDFKMIKAGSIAHANGGFLILNILDIIKTPHIWDTLKRVIKNQKLFIEDLGEQYSILATSGLRPNPIPLDVKIILIGTDAIYRTLYEYDEDFSKIFKMKADFEHQMDRNQATVEDYVKFIKTRVEVENLLPFEACAVAAIVEFGSRVVEDQEKLTTRFSLIKDITIEANFIAQEKKFKKINREAVEQAIEERYHRSAAIEDRMIEYFQREDILISTSSQRVGEINGLAVYTLGDMSFGMPMRITCRTYHGKPGIINIEREASLSGRLHNKGVSILTSWMYANFGSHEPITFSATICFEQNYTGVDGDSATLAELCLILSTLGNIPLHQSIAVTGSVNQFGEVQPIGGVNEKVEGFFKCCQLQGLNGKQGCIIPVQNVKHLMLHKDIRNAIAKKKFHIWPVANVSDAFELLTGYKAGEWNDKKHAFTLNSAFDIIYKKIKKKSHKESSRKSVASKTKKK